jgi:hypothetical protein
MQIAGGSFVLLADCKLSLSALAIIAKQWPARTAAEPPLHDRQQ